MKKFLKPILIFIIILLNSNCSSENNVDYKLNPPDWLIGTWTNSSVEDDMFIIETFIVSSNDIITVLGNGERQSLSQEAENRGQPIEESFNDDERYFVFTGRSYEFNFISDVQIEAPNVSDLIFLKEL